MCLFLNADSKVQISKKPKTVYKKLFARRLVNGELSQSQFNSPFEGEGYQLNKTKSVSNFRGLGYVLGKVTSVKFKDTIPNGTTEIHEGLHAYTTKRKAKSKVSLSIPRSKIVKCIIPAGTPYIVGKYKEIVTLKLKTIEVIYPLTNSKKKV